MSDTPNLTVAELEAMLVRCKLAPQLDWSASLSTVCRQALAQAAELAELFSWRRQEMKASADAHAEAARLRRLLADTTLERDNLQAFKTWVHNYLDAHGVPHHPPGTHGAEGCRIGDRMDWLMARLRTTEVELEALRNPPSPRMVPCPRCQGKHVCVGSEPGLCEFPCYGCNCTGKVKES